MLWYIDASSRILEITRINSTRLAYLYFYDKQRHPEKLTKITVLVMLWWYNKFWWQQTLRSSTKSAFIMATSRGYSGLFCIVIFCSVTIFNVAAGRRQNSDCSNVKQSFLVDKLEVASTILRSPAYGKWSSTPYTNLTTLVLVRLHALNRRFNFQTNITVVSIVATVIFAQNFALQNFSTESMPQIGI